MTETRTDGYAERGKALLAQAEEELAKGDNIQASEKLWGAAAQMVKAVAESRCWPHETHRHLFAAVNRLAEELDEPELRTAFAVANTLHMNFYEGWLPDEYLRTNSNTVEEFVTRLDTLAR